MPDEIVHRTLSFDEFYITFSGNESLLGKQIQALAQTRNGKLNKSTTESGGTSDDDVEIMVDYYHDAVHGNETYSFVTKEFKTKGDYLEKFVVTIENGVNKSGYLRYYPEGDKIEELFTGRVELTNASQTIRFSNYFVKGVRDERTTYGVQKDCTMVFTFGYTRCSHSGNHEYGESCNRGLINDAYLYVLTRVFCTTTITSDIQEMPNQIIDINPGRTGGGGGTSSSTIKFENFVNILNTATKSWLLENYDIKLIVSGYLVQQNFSEESKQTATALLNFIVNDNVLKTNNNKLTEHIVRSSLMGSEFSAQQFMTFWNNLTQQEKMILQNYANNGLSVNNSSLTPSTTTFLSSFLSFSVQNQNISFSDLWFNRNENIDYVISDYNNNTIGNYDNTIYQIVNIQQDWTNVGPVISPSSFIGWGYGNLKQDCMVYCKEQLKNVGFQISNYFANGQTFQVYKESEGVNFDELKKGISYLNYALSNGIPVIVGVDLKSGQSTNPNTDGTTDHFIVIVGMGQDSSGKFLRFYDNATSNQSSGTHVDNKLYYNPSSGKLIGYSKASYAKGKSYTLTMIRKSKSL
ncbi:hypothetical protein EB1_05450 [Empedobacter brevis NBRC 14943 = ATCC 43319]|uniref:Uncharacterized protein n=2 Tax=Empedobacter brevis TaxID=247 RepID=A0A511ND71_9FLAO|nr:hypothetical protein EB1_05450 [Empedobacter brevis NBRC 14943 = ATCC 43319]